MPFEVKIMSKTSSLKTGFIDLTAILFVIGGVISLILSILTIPISSIYPLQTPQSFGFVSAVVLVVSFVCALGSIHCYTLVSRRALSEAGMRGIIFGALLLTFSLGFVGATRDISAQLGAGSAILILIAGAISFVLRESVLPRPPLVTLHQPMASQRPQS
jgi:hypothetical protein